MRNQQLISSIATVCTLALAGSGVAQREPRDLIEWPKERGDFPTLQSAIDALRDNGKLSIQAGRYDFTQSLVVRGKRVTIEGAGCVDSRGNSRNTKETHLAGHLRYGSLLSSSPPGSSPMSPTLEPPTATVVLE